MICRGSERGAVFVCLCLDSALPSGREKENVGGSLDSSAMTLRALLDPLEPGMNETETRRPG